MLDLLKSLYDNCEHSNKNYSKNVTFILIDKDISDDKLIQVGKFLTFYKKTPTKLYKNKVGLSTFLVIEYE